MSQITLPVETIAVIGMVNIRPLVYTTDSVTSYQGGLWDVSVNNFPAIQPISGMVTALQGTSPWVVSGSLGRTWVLSDTTDSISVPNFVSSASSITSLARSTSTAVALASNASRKGAYFHNDSAGEMFIALAATASSTAFTTRLTGQGSYFLGGTPIYTGAISAIWSAGGAGSLRITELT